MSTEQLESKLEGSKRWLMFFAGVTLILLAWAIAGVPSKFSYVWTYYLLWFVFQVTAAATGLMILVNRDWRELPLARRLDPAFGFLAMAWLLFLVFLIKSSRDESYLWGGASTLLLYALVLAAGIVLALSYWMLRRARAHSSEEMFP
ncbi:MAG: hypothetical protein M1570_14220 [Chloroflexi bacterium]|nr:hypothetical protein [Chloroflexota bacterium]